MDDNFGEWVECMGVASGCGNEVYRFPHTTYPYCICSFFKAASLLFVHLKKIFFVLVPVVFCNKI